MDELIHHPLVDLMFFIVILLLVFMLMVSVDLGEPTRNQCTGWFAPAVSVVPALHAFLAEHIDHVRDLPNHKLVGCGCKFQETQATNYSWFKQDLEEEGRFDKM
jgi:hypothetical protein